MNRGRWLLRFLTWTGLLVVCALLLIACHGDSEPQATSTLPAEKGPAASTSDPDGDADFLVRLFQTDERQERGVASLCVDGAGGVTVSDAEFEAVEQALDTALARAHHVPGADTVAREVVRGCPPPLALTGEPIRFVLRHSLEIPARLLVAGDTASPHRLFVYFAEPDLYRATFGDDAFAWTASEWECEGEVDITPAFFEDVPDCRPVTEALYFTPSISPDDLFVAIRGVLMLTPPEERFTPDWHACELGTPEPWCGYYEACVSPDPDPSCEEFWEDTGLEPPP